MREPFWCAAPATPKALRMMKVHHGTVVWNIDDMARTPWRMTPLFSASRPIRKPGQSQK